MILTAEEKLMYEVMRAIYDSGIPVDFKGAMVLKACLMEAGYLDDIRHTVDIDGNWYSEKAPSAEQIEQSVKAALSAKKINLNVNLYRMYGEGKSAGLELIDPDTDEIIFSMDIDVNRPTQDTRIYEVEDLLFKGITPTQMIVDKVSAISSEKVFRRIKDVVDLYYLSHVIEIDIDAFNQTVVKSGRVISDFDAFLNRRDDMLHAYEKFRFRGDSEKPSFDDVYESVKTYLKNILPH